MGFSPKMTVYKMLCPLCHYHKSTCTCVKFTNQKGKLSIHVSERKYSGNWIYESQLSPTSSNGKIFERMNLELKVSHIYYEQLAFSTSSGFLIVSIIS